MLRVRCARMEETRCKFWLPKKRRFCSNAQIKNSQYCGNHSQRSNGQWIPCPIDPSHSVLQENLEGHVKRCPLLKQADSLSIQPFYQKGINAGNEEEEEDGTETPSPIKVSSENVTSEMKRNILYNMSVSQFYRLIKKVESVHSSICKDILDSYKVLEACSIWINREIDRKLPFQEKHVSQQASILGNLEDFGVVKSSAGTENCENKGQCVDDSVSAVVEFGAGRGYLTQMLADCYGIKHVFLVERKSYKFKADRSLRQKENLILERLRIDIEDLNLNGVESLGGVPYVAVSKHLCGPATDLTLRCCLARDNGGSPVLKGLAIATCCHHLCQWKHYINKGYFSKLGISNDEFHAITWFTSWAVDADHGSNFTNAADHTTANLQSNGKEECGEHLSSVEEIMRSMGAGERAVLGFMCKQIIDMGRMMWVKDRRLESKLVKYVPSSVSPENILLIARRP